MSNSLKRPADHDDTIDLTNDNDNNEGKKKTKVRGNASVPDEFFCSITQELMVEPMIAPEDGNTYERSAIIEWLKKSTQSPLDPSTTLLSSNLIANRAVSGAIASIVASGTIDEQMCDEWFARKKELDLVKARQLFEQGQVLEAAKLGLPKAQGEMARRYYIGMRGVDRDYLLSFEFASKAALGEDPNGQCLLGMAHYHGLGPTRNYKEAVKWLEAAANQGNIQGLKWLGLAFEYGGHGITRDLVAAMGWYRKGAEAGDSFCQNALGEFYYKGLSEGGSCTDSLVVARSWYQKSADQSDLIAMCQLGEMVFLGEGGEHNRTQGISLLERAASNGSIRARRLLANLDDALRS